jgi:acyl CoA:acetate/3-ketoacid CoA transferase alpha subunit
MTSKEKVYPTIDAAVADIPDGATIMFGGFGGAGFPNNLIQGLARQGARNLSVISNNCGHRRRGTGAPVQEQADSQSRGGVSRAWRKIFSGTI